MHSLTLTDISISNLKRRRARTTFLVLSLTLAVSMFIGISAAVDSMQSDLSRKMDEFGANMVVMPGFIEAPISYGGIAIGGAVPQGAELDEADAAKILTIRNKENLNAVAPKLLGQVPVGDQRATLVGVRFEDELKIKGWWELVGERPSTDKDIIVGLHAATSLRKTIGSTLLLGSEEFRVAALLNELGGPEDDYVYADLHAVQRLLGKPGKLSLIEVSAWCSSCPIENIVSQTAEKLPNARVTAVKQAITAKQAAVGLISKFALVVTGVVLGIAALIVFSVTMASVGERTREIGLLRALGYRQMDIIRILLTEAEIASLVAGLVGFAVGMLVSRLLVAWVIGWQVDLVWNAQLPFEALLLAVLAGAIGSAYPSWQASNLDPSSALRAI